MAPRIPLMPRRFRRKALRSRRNGFGSHFEEKMTYEYLRNLIHSRFLDSDTEEFFNFMPFSAQPP